MQTFYADYSKFENKSLSVSQLDEMYKIVKEIPIPNIPILNIILSAVKVVLTLWYLLARDKLIDKELAVAKSKFEIAVINQNQNDVNI